MAGDSADHDTLLADSGGFSMAEYIDWQNAKYGSISVRLYAKLHLTHTLHGIICTATGYLRKLQRLDAPTSNGENTSGSRRRLGRRCLRRG